MVAQFNENEKSLKNIATSNIKIDQEQAAAHRKALGYESDSELYTRAFFPPDDPRYGKDKGRKADRLDFNETEAWQREGRGIYFVVNGGGHIDKDVKVGRAIFYEHDNLDKQAQKDLWQTLQLPEPTIQVDTGGKSIHSYWVFESPITIEQWTPLQADLLEFADADRSIKNPSRVMRLAGAYHISQKSVNPSVIVSNSGKRYSLDELRQIIPEKKPSVVELPKPKLQYEYPENRSKWTTRDYALSYLAALHPSRADEYDIWLMVGMALHSIGDPTLLAEYERWSRQSSKFVEGECQKKWNSFKSSGVNIGSLAHYAKLDGWEPSSKPTGSNFASNKLGGRGSGSGGGGDDGGNILSFPLQPFDLKPIEERIKKFFGTNPTEEEIVSEKINIRGDNPRLSERAISELFEIAQKRIERDESRPDLEKETNELLRLGEQSLKLPDYLPAALAEPINLWCKWLNIRPEVALTTVLATMSSLHKVGTKIILSEKRDFSVTPNMFAAIIAESGQKKSPTYRAFAKKPLNQLKKEANEYYLEQCEEYEREFNEWADKKEEAIKEGKGYYEPEPTKPKKPAPFYFNDATGEGITTAAAANPEKTLFTLVDELAAYFNSQNAYRSGKGSDKQDVLSYHDGEGKTVLRAGGVRADVENIYLSIFGTIQPATVKKLMGNSDDEVGEWARFFFVSQPLAPSYMDEDDSGGVNLHERITATYRNCFMLPVQQYRLSREAFKLFVGFYNQLENLRVGHPNSGMRALYSKSEGHTGTLAINLHILEACASGLTPTLEISAETMKKAITLMKFYIGQTKLLYSGMENALAPELVKIIEASKRSQELGGDGWIKISAVQNGITARHRPKAGVVREWFTELEKMGKGITKIVGRSFEFKSCEKSTIDNRQNRQKIDESSIVETLTNKEFQPIIDKIDKIDDSPLAPGENRNTLTTNEIPPTIPPAEIDSFQKSSILSILSIGGCNPCGEGVYTIDESSILGEKSSILDIGTDTTEIHHTESNETTNATSEVPTNKDVATGEEPATQKVQEFPAVVVGQKVKIHAPGMTKDGRTGTVTRIHTLRDGRGKVCTREDGSTFDEAVIQLDITEGAAPQTYKSLLPGNQSSWLEVLG